MAKANKEGTAQIGTEMRESFDATLALKPAEIEALIARLCACGTRRVKSIGPSRMATECGRRIRAEWCRLGDRGASTLRLVDTKFG